MTEEEWLGASKQRPMLEHLRRSGRATAREWRLLVCAALRDPKVWPHLVSRSSQRAVEVSEAFADGAATREDLTRVRKGAHTAAYLRQGRPKQRYAAGLAHNLCWQDAQLLRDGAFSWLGTDAKLLVSVALIREVIGNPFRATRLDTAWRMPTVVSLAQAAYDERALPTGHLDPVRVAVLADALEDAGCSNEAILSHLRSAGPHVRGCWALDLILGKS